MLTHVTPEPWAPTLQHAQYATEETYRLAAAWLQSCRTVSDWGGGTGRFRDFLLPAQAYTCVDGTPQHDAMVLADLTTFRGRSHGILLRHVLEINHAWRTILANALEGCLERLVVVTHTPDALQTHVSKMKSGWPIWHFNPEDLRAAMGEALMSDEAVQTTHPERIYYLERACRS